MIKSKYLLWGGIAGAVVAGGLYLLKLGRLSKELETVTSAMIHKITAKSIILRVDSTMKNPTGGTMNVKYPFVKLKYNGGVIGSSESKNKDFTIPKYGEVKIDPIFITVPLSSLGFSITKILKELLKKPEKQEIEKKKIQIETTTTINNTIPFKKIEETTIGNKGE